MTPWLVPLAVLMLTGVAAAMWWSGVLTFGEVPGREWGALNATLVTEKRGDTMHAHIDAELDDLEGGSLSWDEAADVPRFVWLAGREAVEGDAVDDSRWRSCDLDRCAFEFPVGYHLYVDLLHDGDEPGIYIGTTWLDPVRGMSSSYSSGGWDFEEPWNGSYTMWLARGKSLPTLAKDELEISVLEIAPETGPCEGLTGGHDDQCLHVRLRIRLGHRAAGNLTLSRGWSASDGETRLLLLNTAGADEVAPGGEAELTVFVPAGDRFSPRYLEFEPREFNDSEPWRVSLGLA